MNKLEQMHLDTMIVKDLQSAVRSAEITEKIAIEFAEWLGELKYKIQPPDCISGEVCWGNKSDFTNPSTEMLFQKFLKTKQ